MRVCKRGRKRGDHKTREHAKDQGMNTNADKIRGKRRKSKDWPPFSIDPPVPERR